MIDFGFAFHWLKKWRETFKPITNRSNRVIQCLWQLFQNCFIPQHKCTGISFCLLLFSVRVRIGKRDSLVFSPDSVCLGYSAYLVNLLRFLVIYFAFFDRALSYMRLHDGFLIRRLYRGHHQPRLLNLPSMCFYPGKCR